MGALPDDDGRAKPAELAAIGLRLGMSLKETMQLPVGLVLDLWELYRRSHGIKSGDE